MATLSIFTCVIGEPEALLNTANSIAPWLSNDVVWIIKFSEKTSKNFIANFSGKHIQVYQESDSSLYDALNQCLKKSLTDYYMVLGAGDTILPDGMSQLIKELSKNTFTHHAYHAPLLVELSNNIFNPAPNQMKHGMSCPHPTSILKVKNSLAIDGFDLSYKIASDYDHLSRYAIAFGDGHLLNISPPVSYMGGGISDIRALESYMEALLIRQRIWNIPDMRIFGDLLKFTALPISETIAQNTP
ncbi:hypothetical protein [Polynucleobacter sp. JS-Polo-80-F4]|uniref:hypothetical protein n=1 Tax=Polynucleobacter sp. JS-Polo-80-F4 TaxID=2576918 RepID=UPI001C0D4907|nr:hypothetical protein [Polynucleobacter sp. JS-Polo-80-F4]MBU3616544.1 hypothetical protein [Polynucleobacter sp. JS-Polo-80-F4]